jgi:hypothetical protein
MAMRTTTFGYFANCDIYLMRFTIGLLLVVLIIITGILLRIVGKNLLIGHAHD